MRDDRPRLVYTRHQLIRLRVTAGSKHESLQPTLLAAGVRDVIRGMGCARRLRGCRAGKRSRDRRNVNNNNNTNVVLRSADRSQYQIPVLTSLRERDGEPLQLYRGRREPRAAVRRQLQLSTDVHATSSHRRAVDSLPTLYVLNPTSLAKPLALQQLATDLTAYDVDIAVITETWFKSRHTDQAVALPGYTVFRRDRHKRRGGGVAIYAKTNLNAKPCDITVTDPRLELFWVQLKYNNKTIVIGALYHPPKPLYSSAELIDEIDRSIEQIVNSSMDTTVILAGDFNQLPDSAVKQLGLHGIFCGPSHAGHCLDRVYATKPIYNSCKCVISTINTAHRAVIASDSGLQVDINKKHSARQYRPVTPNQNAAFLAHLSDKNWDDVMNVCDTQIAFDIFYANVLNMLETFYPMHTVTVTNRDPYFVTPKIKALLRKRNKLMRKGKVDKAESITKKISQCVTVQAKATFSTCPKG